MRRSHCLTVLALLLVHPLGCVPYEDETSDACAAEASDAIARALDGEVVGIPCATVTYVRPAIGDDLAGFFVQAEKDGPALYIAVEADVVPGQLVGFRVEATDVISQVRRRVTEISELTDFGTSPYTLPMLTSDHTNNSAIWDERRDSDYSLGFAAGRLDTWFGHSGVGFMGAGFNPMALQSDISGYYPVKFRVTEALWNTWGLVQSCVIEVGPTPLWPREGADPDHDILYFTAWEQHQLSVLECPRAHVAAARTGPESVTLSLSVPPSILEVVNANEEWPTRHWGSADASYFDVDSLSATEAVADGSLLVLTVPGLADDAPLELHIDDAARDLIGQRLDY